MRKGTAAFKRDEGKNALLTVAIQWIKVQRAQKPNNS